MGKVTELTKRIINRVIYVETNQGALTTVGPLPQAKSAWGGELNFIMQTIVSYH